jgi:hypothetical protein
MFEYCSAQTQIVVGYEEDFLMLIAMRHNATGIASFPPLWPCSSSLCLCVSLTQSLLSHTTTTTTTRSVS